MMNNSNYQSARGTSRGNSRSNSRGDSRGASRGRGNRNSSDYQHVNISCQVQMNPQVKYYEVLPKKVSQYIYNYVLFQMKESSYPETQMTFKSLFYTEEYKSCTDLYNNTCNTRKTKTLQINPQDDVYIAYVQKEFLSAIPQQSVDMKKTIMSAGQRYTYTLPDYEIILTCYKHRKTTVYSVKAKVQFPNTCIDEFKDLISKSLSTSEIIKSYNSIFTSFFSKKPYIDKSIPYTDHFTPKNIYHSSTNILPYLKDYAVQPKITNSMTRFCYFLNEKVYMIDPYNVDIYIEDISDDLSGTVVIGEYKGLVGSSSDLQNGVFWATDILFFNKHDCTDLILSERIKKLNEVVEMLGCKNFQYLPYFTYDEIPRSINEALKWNESTTDFSVCTDGLIFKALYLPFYDKSTYKWKSAAKTTIDLKVFFSHESNNIQRYALYASGTTGPYPYEAFHGDADRTHLGYIDTSSTLVKERMSVDRIANESIVEFEYKGGCLLPVKIRRDKVKPNFVIITEQIWEQMTNPVTEETLLSLTENLVDSEKSDAYNYATINIYLTHTHDPTVFFNLNEHIFSSHIPQTFGEEAIESVKNSTSSELSRILHSFFTTCTM
jgi:hypothetical protein